MKRRSGIQIMGKLIGLVAPLMHVMAGAVYIRCCRLFVRDLSDYFCSAGNFENPSTGVGRQCRFLWGVVGYTDDSDVNLCCCQGALSLRRAGLQPLYCL